MQDTSPEAIDIQTEIYRGMTPGARFEAAWNLSLTAREFALAGIRRENPGIPESSVMDLYIRKILLRDTPHT